MHKKGTHNFGHLLHVNLTAGTISLVKFSETGKSFLGGRGFNIWYLFNHLEKGTDPLGEDNILLISCGLLTGSAAPASSRLHINSLSPLTGILGSSNIGGYAGAWLRSCNIASIIITGKSVRPVYLYINPHDIHLADAQDLWGKQTIEAQNLLNAKHGHKKIKTLVIGPAGENLVRFAAIISGKDHAAGRTGMGAVMGAKNLKAIVIEKGSHKNFPAVTPVQKKAVQDYVRLIRQSPEFDTFSRLGGAGYVAWVNDFGIMGSKNYSGLEVDYISKLDGKNLEKNIRKSSGCFRCPVQCKADLVFKDAGQKTFTRPEFEPMINLGPKCGVTDIRQVIELDNLCNRLGMDSTSAATVIAFAMDLFDRKLLPEALAEGLDLTWGNTVTMKMLLFQMVQNKGLGKILRLGVKQAADRFGKASEPYAAHVKGLELTAYHPGAIMGTALGYAVSSRGGDYNNVYASMEYSMSEEEAVKAFGSREAVDIKKVSAKGLLIRKAVINNCLIDSLGLCKVPVLSLLRSFNFEHEIPLINALCDLDLTRDALYDSGMRIADIERRFNLRHAPAPLQDSLPEMFFKKSAAPEISRNDFRTMLQEYYKAMGWDENGIPPGELHE